MKTTSENEKMHTFTWKIANFNSCTQRRDACLKSPVFTAESLDRTNWYLSLYPRGVKWDQDAIGCFLNRHEDKGAAEFKCKFNLEMIGADDIPVVSYVQTASFKKGTNLGSYNFLKKEHLNNYTYSSKDTLKIRCQIIVHTPKIVLASENIARTSIVVDRCSFSWNVKGFNNPTSKEIIGCPPLVASRFEFCVQVPNDDLKVKIRRTQNFSISLSMICKVSLLDVKGQEQSSRQALHLFESCDSTDDDKWVFPDFIKKSDLNSDKGKYLTGGFTLHFEVSISSGASSNSTAEKVCDSSTDKDSSSKMKILTCLQDDLKRIYFNKSQTDLEFRADNKVFHVHKCILSVRSSVFLAMFDQDTAENPVKLIDIFDVDCGTLEWLLEFLYTGTVRNLDDEKAVKLLVAADRYKVSSLKEECSSFLTSVISDRNVCDILISADLVQHEHLKASAVNHIKKNTKNIFASEDWTYCIEKNPELAAETVLKVSSVIGASSNSYFDK